MLNLKDYIIESGRVLKQGETGIVVFDIDDTLVHADESQIGIIKYIGGDKSNKIRLSTDEYAIDPDASNHKDWFSYEEFDNPEKVMKSIINGTPLIKNLHIMDKYLSYGYKFAFLTARGCEDAVKYALKKFLMTKDNDDTLRLLGDEFNVKDSAAINDRNKNYPGNTDAEKKANVLKDLCSKYDKVVFVDDDVKNILLAKALNLNNLTVIKAKK